MSGRCKAARAGRAASLPGRSAVCGPARVRGGGTPGADRDPGAVLPALGIPREQLPADVDEQGAVPAAFDLSYARLPAPARRMFRLLGLVPGRDITTGAAAALAGVDPPAAGGLLDGLAGAHLVEEHAVGQYGCHDLLRRYATDRAQAQEAAADQRAALARLHDFYLGAADAAVRAVNPVLVRLPVPRTGAAPRFDDRGQALAWLDAERANLVAMIVHADAHGAPPIGWRLADVLRGYFVLSPYLDDWLTVAQAGLSAATGAGDDHEALAAAHLNLANVHFRRSGHRETIVHARARRWHRPVAPSGWRGRRPL